jgi:hypothetical protein
MSIIYTLISRNEPDGREDTILTEFYQASGNFPSLTKNVLKKIERNKTLTLQWNNKYNDLMIKKFLIN